VNAHPGLRLLAASLLIGAWISCADGVAGAADPLVYVSDVSTAVSKADVLDALPAFQAAVSDDLAPLWGANATLVYSDSPPAGAPRITLTGDAAWVALTGGWDAESALGYHDVGAGVPFALVLAGRTIASGGSWQVVFSHELFELLVDPYNDRAVRGSGRWWLAEVADPVEAAALAYTLPSASGRPVAISDFITPAWYHTGAPGPYDFAGRLQQPFQLLPGGYASVWRRRGWTPVHPKP
jgi:hypothetical protein